MSSNSSARYADCGVKYFLTGNFLAYVCALPVFLSVMREGFRRWRGRGRRPGSVSTATSNVDVFAYNMVAQELLGMAGVFLYMLAEWTSYSVLRIPVIYVVTMTSTAPVLFYVLTCVDCYLAVLRPVAYLRLRSGAGVRLRNAAAAAVWLLTLALGVVRSFVDRTNLMYISLVTSALVAVSFCCVAVLRALIRPKPGDGGGAGERVDQSKRRALHTVMAVLAALLTRFSVNLVTEIIRAAEGVAWTRRICLVTMTTMIFHLPSSLVLPLLFLQRAKKFPFSAAAAAATRKFPFTAAASYNLTKPPQTPQN